MATAGATAMTSQAFLRNHKSHFLLPHFSSPRTHRRPLSMFAAHQSTNVIDILQECGLLEATTRDKLRSACSNSSVSSIKVYCGFNPTAESLHLGNLLRIIMLSCMYSSVDTYMAGFSGQFILLVFLKHEHGLGWIWLPCRWAETLDLRQIEDHLPLYTEMITLPSRK